MFFPGTVLPTPPETARLLRLPQRVRPRPRAAAAAAALHRRHRLLRQRRLLRAQAGPGRQQPPHAQAAAADGCGRAAAADGRHGSGAADKEQQRDKSGEKNKKNAN